jgi:hypothetical protein
MPSAIVKAISWTAVDQVLGTIREGVDDQSHRLAGRIDVGTSGDVLLQDVVLDGPLDQFTRYSLLLGDQLVEEEQGGRSGVDGHRRRDLVERQVGQEQAHVDQRVDGDAHLAHLAFGARVVGVIAHLRREIEGARETGLTSVEQELEALIGRGGGAKPCVLAHRPEPLAVHLGVDAPGVGIGAGCSEFAGGIPVGKVCLGIEGLDLDTRIGVAFGRRLFGAHPSRLGPRQHLLANRALD